MKIYRTSLNVRKHLSTTDHLSFINVKLLLVLFSNHSRFFMPDDTRHVRCRLNTTHCTIVLLEQQEIDTWAFSAAAIFNGSRLERWMRNNMRQPILVRWLRGRRVA